MSYTPRQSLSCLIILPLILIGVASGASHASDVDFYALEGRVLRDPNDLKTRMTLGKEYTRRFDESRAAEDGAKAHRHLEYAVKLDPGSIEAKARFDVVLCLEARESNSHSKAKSALADLDRLVQANPSHPLVRELRGFAGIECPAEYERAGQALEDLTAVEEQIRKTPTIVQTYDLNVPKVYLKLGKCYRAKGDMVNAKKWWQKAVDTGGDTREAKSAARLLGKNR